MANARPYSVKSPHRMCIAVAYVTSFLEGCPCRTPIVAVFNMRARNCESCVISKPSVLKFVYLQSSS